MDILDGLVIVNDGHLFSEFHEITQTLINNPENLGVGKSKNIALRYLHERNVDHFFLIDDVYNKKIGVRAIYSGVEDRWHSTFHVQSGDPRLSR
ncbi:hypothetical protein AU490_09760 [Lonsdalea populi]|uniref:Uncharacterized protein n=1 Tax=Lonsdalea populi TaxID=1172565 RepID=A0A3N0UBY9_9GAMM|nr:MULTISPECIES: hypothetical protein [Lonsdalea]OSN01703.1 hypothetical protein AU499_05070 [Lonsdalea populi]QPQ25413.1 hypothetical protein I6N93_06495 [Lonsdalea populi]RAT17256.1 hypothetical protein AU486_05460 [Lonsdalea quercina]RAT28331.1 hypothetical protein AU490_09760 [Lonsdalea populi]RAT30003.1 hypothetical protein AU491_16205 [Lonsdalea populi]